MSPFGMLWLWLQPIAVTIGWALLHFVWQGALLAAMLAIARRLLRSRPAQERYLVACLTLLLMSLCPLLTLVQQRQSHEQNPGLSAMPAPVMAMTVTQNGSLPPGPQLHPSETGYLAHTTILTGDLARALEGWLPPGVMCWLVGILLLSGRMLGAWLLLRRLTRRDVATLTGAPADLLAELAARMQVRRLPLLLESRLVGVPTLLGGWATGMRAGFRSAILLPTGLVAGLSQPMLEALLAHELAHLRRHDDLINLWQTGIETLLFYHPAVWWVSRYIREERETCCDERVVALLDDRNTYARALLALEEHKSRPMALAANGGLLLTRIQHILTGKITANSDPQIGASKMEPKMNLKTDLLKSLSRSRPHPATALVPLVALLLVTGCTTQLFVASPIQPTPALPLRQATVTPTTPAPAAETTTTEQTQEQIDREVLAHLQVHGPGIELILQDSTRTSHPGSANAAAALIRDADLQNVVQALHLAEAEAISINGVRLYDRSFIHSAGSAILIDDHVLTSPYVIDAIGNPTALTKALNHGWGPLITPRLFDPGMVTLTQKSDLIVPALHTTTHLRYASPTDAGYLTPPTRIYPLVPPPRIDQRLQQERDKAVAQQLLREREVAEKEAELARKLAAEQEQAARAQADRARSIQEELAKRLAEEQDKAQLRAKEQQEEAQLRAKERQVEAEEQALNAKIHADKASLELIYKQAEFAYKLADKQQAEAQKQVAEAMLQADNASRLELEQEKARLRERANGSKAPLP